MCGWNLIAELCVDSLFISDFASVLRTFTVRVFYTRSLFDAHGVFLMMGDIARSPIECAH